MNSSSSISLRNNILWVDAGYDIYVASDSQVGFRSDYNTLMTSGTGTLASWASRTFSDLADWRYEVGQDEHSLVSDPLFIDRDGADNVLGGTQGADDNFQVGVGSPTIDAGDPASPYVGEPGPNGRRVNQGYTGNSSLALTSPAETIQVLSPNGLDKYEVGQPVTIRWQASGLTQVQPAALVNVGGAEQGGWQGSAYQTVSYSNNSFTNAVDRSGVTNPAPEGVYQSYAYSQ